MGSKTPPPIEPALDEAQENDPRRSALSDDPAGSLLLRRIAGALQVPLSALYNPPDAVGTAPLSRGAAAFDIDGECVVLLHAYRRIRDPAERRRFMILVQEAAERT